MQGAGHREGGNPGGSDLQLPAQSRRLPPPPAPNPLQTPGPRPVPASGLSRPGLQPRGWLEPRVFASLSARCRHLSQPRTQLSPSGCGAEADRRPAHARKLLLWSGRRESTCGSGANGPSSPSAPPISAVPNRLCPSQGSRCIEATVAEFCTWVALPSTRVQNLRSLGCRGGQGPANNRAPSCRHLPPRAGTAPFSCKANPCPIGPLYHEV